MAKAKREKTTKSKASRKEKVSFSEYPKEDQLRPTERQKRVIRELFSWEKRSANTHFTMGEPIDV